MRMKKFATVRAIAIVFAATACGTSSNDRSASERTADSGNGDAPTGGSFPSGDGCGNCRESQERRSAKPLPYGGGDDGGADSGGPEPLHCTPDTFIRPATPWVEPSGQTDSYVCYGFDVTVPRKRHVIGLAPKIDNKKIVDRLLLFQAPNSVSATPAGCSSSGPPDGRLIAEWAPGGRNLELPPEAGFPESATTHWVLQAHYNATSTALDGEKDESGFDLCTTDKLRANDADVMALGSIKFSIPPHSKMSLSCDWNVGPTPDIHVFASSPHMRKLGTALSTYVEPKGGGEAGKIVDVSFDFQTQLGYTVTQVVHAGDTVTTRCQYANPGDDPVPSGEKTTDETCFDFLAYYPKVPTPAWEWALPAATSQCTWVTQ